MGEPQLVTIREFDLLREMLTQQHEMVMQVAEQSLAEARKTNGRVTSLEIKTGEVRADLVSFRREKATREAKDHRKTAGITIITTAIVNGIIAAISSMGGGK